MTDHGGPGSPPSNDPSPDDVYDAMEPLEPYTTTELANRLRASIERIRTRLRTLVADELVRRKEPEPGVTIWIREPPAHTCPVCGYEFQVKFLHPILSTVRLCPQCGTRIE